MWCKDPFLGLLKQFGYNVVRLPRANIAPLQVLSRSGSNLDMLGELASVLKCGTLPTIARDALSATISGSKAKTGGMEAGVATGLLGGVIAAMGGAKVGIEAAYANAKSITFEFLDVTQDSISITDLDKYLSAAKPDPESRAMERLLKSNGIYVLTATIKSKKIQVRAEDSSGQSVKLDLDGVQQLVGGKVGVKGDGKYASAVVYEGPVPLIFGFQAVQVLFEKAGEYEGFKRIDADAVGMREIDSTSGETVLLDTANSPFVRLVQPPTEVGRRALIIGVNTYPKLAARHQLKGCVNDAKVIAATLRDQFAFADADVEVLLDEAATRDAILAGMDRLVERTAPQDVVVIHYSGHGSEVNDREGDEPSGKDQTIVPSDSGRAEPHPNRDITDDEIFDRLRRLAAKTDRITLLFDCCHSGTISRDTDFGETARSLEGETRPDSVLPVPSVSAETIAAMIGTRDVGPSGFLPIDGSYVLIAGCRDEEKSFEHRVREASGEVRHGALTYFLTQEIAKAPAGATYRDVFERAAARVTATFLNQHPQMEGAADRELFGMADRNAVRSVAVDRDADGAITLSAGAAHGVAQGSKWAVYPQGHKETDGDAGRLGLVKITSVGPLASQATIVDATKPEAIATGCRAVEVEQHLGAMSLRVHIEEVGVAGAAESLRLAFAGSLLLREADTSNADARVYALPAGDPDARSGRVPQLGTLGEATWAVVGRDGLLMFPAATIADSDSIERIRTNLEKLARYRNALALENRDPSNPIAGKVRLELLRRLADGTWIEANPGADGRLVFREGDTVGIRIINDHDAPVYVSVLDFGLTGRVKQLYPARGAQPAHKPGIFNPGLVIQLGMPKDFDPTRKEGQESFKLIATTEPADFTLLEQDATRDAFDVDQRSPLEQLLFGAGSGTRDADVEMPSNLGWTTSLRGFTLARKDAP